MTDKKYKTEGRVTLYVETDFLDNGADDLDTQAWEALKLASGARWDRLKGVEVDGVERTG